MTPSRITVADVVAGVSVALLLIPQSLAYAGIAGVPPAVGLYAAAIPAVAAAIFASSPYLQTGPTAMTALLAFGAVSSLAEPLSAEFVALTALFALLVGVMQLGIGLTKLGVVAYFISRPVMTGFTWGAVILIVASQIPTLLGVERGDGGLIGEAFSALTSPGDWHTGSLLFGLAAMVVIEGARRLNRKAPGVLVAVAGAIGLSLATGFTGSTVGAIPEGLPGLFLDMPWGSAGSLLIPAIVISLVAFTEAAALSTVYAVQDQARWDPSREFVSQGTANIAAGFSSGFLVGASFSRSSVNRLTGARTRWSGAVTGLTVLAFLPIVGVLESLPSSVLAAVVIVAVVRLISPGEATSLVHGSRLQAGVALATLVLTLALSPHIDIAVIIGVVLAIVVQARSGFRMGVSVDVSEETMRLSVSGVIFFGSTPRLMRAFRKSMSQHEGIERLVIDLGETRQVVFTGGDALQTIAIHAMAAGLEVEIVQVPDGSQRAVAGVLAAVRRDS